MRPAYGLLAAVFALLMPHQPARSISGETGPVRRFDFKVLNPSTSIFITTPKKKLRWQTCGADAERWYARLSKLLQHELRGRQPLICTRSSAFLNNTNPCPVKSARARRRDRKRKRRVHSGRSPGGLAETDHVLGTSSYTRFSTTSRGADRSAGPAHRPAPGAAAVVHRRHGLVPLDWADRRPHRNVGCFKRRLATRCRRSNNDDPDSSVSLRSRLLGYVAGRWAIRPSATCCAPPGPKAIETAIASGARHRRRHPDQGVARRHAPLVRGGVRDDETGATAFLRTLISRNVGPTEPCRRRSAPTASA